MSDSWDDQFKDVGSLKDYSEAQHKTIVQQSKKITQLENELIQVKSQLMLTPLSAVTSLPDGLDLSSKDEEVISKIEIQKLRVHSMTRELTMEECKKLETYAKILMAIGTIKKPMVIDTTVMTTESLLQAVQSADNSNE